LLLKHWLKQTEVNASEKWGYEDPEVIPEAEAGESMATAQSDHDVAEGADSDAEAALDSSSGLSELSDRATLA
jgi:hypothetical protein